MHRVTKQWVAALVGVGGLCSGLSEAQACGGRGAVTVYRARPAYTAPVVYAAPRQCAPTPQFAPPQVAPPGQFRAVVQPVAPRPQGVLPGQPGLGQPAVGQPAGAFPGGALTAGQPAQPGSAPMGLAALGGQSAAQASLAQPQAGPSPQQLAGQPLAGQPAQSRPALTQPALTQPAQGQSAAPRTSAPMSAAQQSALQALGNLGDEEASSSSAPAAQEAPAGASPVPVTAGHVGSWKASVSNGAIVRLSLRADGSFEWIATQGEKTSSFDGNYTLENGALTLVRSSDNQKLAGALTPTGNGGFHFKLAGAKDNGLEFQRG